MRNIKLFISKIRSNLFPEFSGAITSDAILKQVIRDYQTSNLSSDEKVDIQSIEDIRKKLLHNKEVISSPEYGAGSRIIPKKKYNRELVKDVARTSSKNKEACRLLYLLIKNLKPFHAIELGTCLGISCAYQALALLHNKRGKLISIEGSPERANLALKTLNDLSFNNIAEVINNRFEEAMIDILPKIDFIDYAFIDGHHEEKATLKYYNQLLPYFKKGGIIVFDDIFWSKGMNKAWETIKAENYGSQTMEYKGMGFILLSESGFIGL